jgi:hypothetical protein
MTPTVESVFGDNAFVTDPKPGGSGSNGLKYDYNPIYFATPLTASIVARALGGTVVAMNAITPFGPFIQNQPNLMVQMPDGKLINAGLIANWFSHGYPQSYIDQQIALEIGADFHWPVK